MILKPNTHNLGGFAVRRSLPHAGRKMVGPWIFFDHFGPTDFTAGQGIDVRPHPHIGLATVTYLISGEILHRDSLGSVQTIQPGAINLMVAGRGIAHSERTGPELRAAGHTLHGLQLWLALPDDLQECEPAFYHHAADSIPARHGDGVSIRVMIGEAFGLLSPVKQFASSLYAEVKLEAGAGLQLPAISEIAVYVVSGTVTLQDEKLERHQMSVIDNPSSESVAAEKKSHVVIIGGAPVGERFIWWNFVSNDRQRIEQAKQQWQRREFEPVPEETEFIPLPDR